MAAAVDPQYGDLADRAKAHSWMRKDYLEIRRLLFIVACLLWAGGCATAEQSDHPAAIACIGSGCAAREPNNPIALLGRQPYQETGSYYSRHCDEQTREMQHELANCTAVPLVDIPLKSSPRS
jgi:hypothetical protein